MKKAPGGDYLCHTQGQSTHQMLSSPQIYNYYSKKTAFMNGDFKKEVIDRSLDDIKVELDEEFDRNFQRKAFFNEKRCRSGNSMTESVRSWSAPADYGAASGAVNGRANWPIRRPNPMPASTTKGTKSG